MGAEQKRYLAAGMCVLFFLLAQTFQEITYRVWIPTPQNGEQELLVYLLAVDRIRAFLVLASILSLIVAYVVIALRYWRMAPVLSSLGLLFGAAFVGFEITARSFEIFVVGERWAQAFHSSVDSAVRAALLGRFEFWSETIRGWYFPERLAHLLASVCFGLAALRDHDSWGRLATLAFFLNALRLLGRLLSTYGDQAWLAGLNDRFYYPIVGVINLMWVLWLFHLSRTDSRDPV